MSQDPHVIAHSRRDALLGAVKEVASGLGAGDVLVPKSKEECVERLIKHPDAILVLDWELGSEEVNLVLGAIRTHFRVETRPILLVIPEIEANVIATATEYGVLQVHAGEVSVASIKDCLQALLHDEEATRAIRDVLLKVATARSKDDWTVVTPLLLELYESNKENDRVAVELAENLIYEESWDHAIQVLEPLAATEPPHVRALHLLGRCHLRKGDAPKAIALLERAKLINPHNVDRLIDLGDALLTDDQIEAAKANFSEALALDEGNKDATVGTGKCLLMNGEVNEALTLLKDVSGPRELASIFNTAAVLSMHQGRFEKGMHLYKSAMAALGRNDKLASRLMFNMGLGYKRWHKPEKAIACFEKSLALDPTYVKALKHKEQVLKQAGGSHPPASAGSSAMKPAPEAPPADSREFAEEEFTNIKGKAPAATPAVPEELPEADLDDDAE